MSPVTDRSKPETKSLRSQTVRKIGTSLITELRYPRSKDHESLFYLSQIKFSSFSMKFQEDNYEILLYTKTSGLQGPNFVSEDGKAEFDGFF